MHPVKSLVKPGFTLSEVLVSLLLVGVLATIMVPSINKGMTQTTQLNAVKTTANELGQAYTRVNKGGTSIITDMTTAQDIIDEMNYVRIINDASQSVQVPTSSGGTTSATCSGTRRCALLQNGALLQYNPQAVFGGTVVNESCLRFVIDPDGSGSKLGTELLMFYGSRVTTVPLFVQEYLLYGGSASVAAFTTNVSSDGTTVTSTNDTLPAMGQSTSLADPDYLDSWVDG